MKTKDTRRGYRMYSRWADKIYWQIVAGKSRYELPLTIKKWRRATGCKLPA